MIDDDARALLRTAADDMPVSPAPVEGVLRQGRRLRRRRRIGTTLGAAGTLAAVAVVVSTGWLGIGGLGLPGLTGPDHHGDGPAASGTTHSQTSRHATEPPSQKPALAGRLVGTWRLRAIPGQTPPLTSVGDGPTLLRITALAAPQGLHWALSEGCRRVGGSAHIDTEGSWTTWGTHTTTNPTAANCRPSGTGPGTRRTEVAHDVESAATVRVSGDRLELVGADSTTLAAFSRASTAPDSAQGSTR